MSPDTLLISGPPGGGKSVLARLISAHVLERPAHYLRVRAAADGHTNLVVQGLNGESADNADASAWASTHHVTYTPDRVFETLPDALRAARDMERCDFVIIEANDDPALRYAYPYDYRVFVMSSPREIHEVFRDSQESAEALRQVMQDTAAFAAEIFGLFDQVDMDDDAGVLHRRPRASFPGRTQVEELQVGESQIRQFLSSPLGTEIASRIQLQPAYHAMAESDVVVINTGLGGEGGALRECMSRVERLLGRVRHDARRHSLLYWGDIIDVGDPTRHRLLRRLRSLLVDAS